MGLTSGTWKHRKHIRVFVASPGDVSEEKAHLAIVVDRLNQIIGEILPVKLDLAEWSQAVPGLGKNPQQVIFSQIPVESWDIFVGILWLRFGTPTGNVNARTGVAFQSGTEEEFEAAATAWRAAGKPRVMFYRCDRPPERATQMDAEQWQRISSFFKQFEAEGAYAGIYTTYITVEEFENHVQSHLLRCIQETVDKPRSSDLGELELDLARREVIDTLPRRSEFVGRQSELEQIRAALAPDDRGWGIAIDGMGGMGKTAIAVEAAYDAKSRGLFDVYIFHTAQEPELLTEAAGSSSERTRSVDFLIQEVARTLGYSGISSLERAEDRRRTLLDALRNRRALIIFDNLETLTRDELHQLEQFLRYLPQQCKAIITSRMEFHGAARLHLDRLPWLEAKQLIASRIKGHPSELRALAEAGESAWRTLYDGTGGSPIGILWVIGLVTERRSPFSKALKMLQNPASDDELNRFLFENTYRTMDANERRVLSSLSLFEAPASESALAFVAGVHGDMLNTAVQSLLRLNMVDSVDRGEDATFYLLHPLTRRFAQSVSQTDAGTESAARRFAEYWVRHAAKYGGFEKDAYRTYFRLEEEWSNLKRAADWAWHHTGLPGDTVTDEPAAIMVRDLANHLGVFLWFTGRWEERVELHGRAYEITRRMADYGEAAWHAHVLAMEHFSRGHTEDALQWLARGNDFFARERSHRDLRYVKAALLRTAGLIEARRGRYQVAEELLTEALAIQQDRGIQEYIAQGLTDLGDLGSAREQFELAKTYYGKALEVAEQNRDVKAQAFALGNLAEIDIKKRDWGEAKARLEEKLRLARDLGFDFLIADARYRLAEVWEAEERFDLAFPLAQQAYSAFLKLKPADVPAARELLDRVRAKVGELS